MLGGEIADAAWDSDNALMHANSTTRATVCVKRKTKIDHYYGTEIGDVFSRCSKRRKIDTSNQACANITSSTLPTPDALSCDRSKQVSWTSPTPSSTSQSPSRSSSLSPVILPVTVDNADESADNTNIALSPRADPITLNPTDRNVAEVLETDFENDVALPEENTTTPKTARKPLADITHLLVNYADTDDAIVFNSVQEAHYVFPEITKQQFFELLSRDSDDEELEIIFDHWKTDERTQKSLLKQMNISWIRTHHEVNPIHRGKLIDWMAELCEEQNLWKSTFYRAVHFFDLFMSNMVDFIRVSDLQLIGVTMVHQAAKIEDKQFESDTFLSYALRYAIDDIIDEEERCNCQIKLRKQVVEYERKFLTSIQYNATFSTVLDFMERSYHLASLLRDSSDISPKVKETCIYDIQACMTIYECLQFANSQLAAAIFHLNYPCDDDRSELAYLCTGYKVEQLTSCIQFAQHVMRYADMYKDEPVESMLNAYYTSSPAQQY